MMKRNLILLGIIVFIQVVMSLFPKLASWYSIYVSEFFVQTIGRISDLFPFSLFEW